MNPKNKKNESSFSGFLDGYKASNIASIETTLIYHIKQIGIQLEEISVLLTKHNSLDAGNFLNRSLNDIKNMDIDIVKKSMSLGESIYTFMTIYKDINEKLHIEQKLKNITFHFLSLAEKSQDTELLSIAVKIGEVLSKNYPQLTKV